MTETTTSAPQDLWLTQLHLDPRNRKIVQALADAHEMHRIIMALFPEALGESPRAAAAVLHRVEEDSQGISVLVQSALKPTGAEALPGVLAAATKPLVSWWERIEQGLTVRYRIAGNPSKMLNRPGDKLHGKRVHLYGAEADKWWSRKAEANGLALHTVESRPHRPTGGRRKGNRVVHHAVRFDGVAQVVDAEAARYALVHGIGRGRAHGLGMLSLAPQK